MNRNQEIMRDAADNFIAYNRLAADPARVSARLALWRVCIGIAALCAFGAPIALGILLLDSTAVFWALLAAYVLGLLAVAAAVRSAQTRGRKVGK